MGAYKGRVNLKHRRKRFIKAQRVRALSARVKADQGLTATENKADSFSSS
jgi:hypothetical protein